MSSAWSSFRYPSISHYHSCLFLIFQRRFARPGQADVEEHPLLQLIRAMRSPTSFEDLIDIEERLGCMMRGADER